MRILRVESLVRGGSSEEQARRIFWHLVSFLQKHGMTKRVVFGELDHITGTSELWSDDLTGESWAFLKTAEPKYLRRFDRNRDADPADTRLPEKELGKLRGSKH